jgi:superfamily I DNA/RNA helicase
VLKHLVKKLIKENKVDPSRIFCSSFSRNANVEMSAKFKEMLGREISSNIYVNTIHAFCFHIIKEFPNKVPFGKVDLVSNNYLASILEAQFMQFNSKVEFNFILTLIGDYYNAVMSNDYTEYNDKYENDSKVIMEESLEHLHDKNKATFTDLLIHGYRLLKNDREVKAKYRNAFDYLIFDECQDFNFIQLSIIEELINDTNKVILVGDAKQSVYGFQGSNYKLLMYFRDRYEAKVYTLSETFRFGKDIARLSNKVIDHMTFLDDDFKKDTSTKVKINKNPKFFLGHEYSERHLCEQIEDQVAKGIDPKDITIMYRNNKDSMEFQKILNEMNIPYDVESGNMLQRKEIRFLLNAVELTQSFDHQKLIDVIKPYNNNISKKVIGEIMQESTVDDQSDVFRFLEFGIESDIKNIGATRKSGLSFVLSKLKDLKKYLDEYKVVDFKHVVSLMEMHQCDFMKHGKTITGADNHDERMEFIESFQGQYINQEQHNVFKYFDILRANFGSSHISNQPKGVLLRTVHGSKGCTYPYVYLWADNIASPFWIKTNGYEDETFVFYVAVTRPSRELNIYHTSPESFKYNFVFPGDFPTVEETNSNQAKEMAQVGNEDQQHLRHFSSAELQKFKDTIQRDKKGSYKPLRGYRLELVREKAVLFKKDKKAIWCPRKSIALDMGIFHIPQWLINKNNLEI